MSDDKPEFDPLAEIRVVGGEPSAEETAAAVAVMAGMLREGGAVDSVPARDRWSASARTGREAADRGSQTWDEFTGQ